MDGIVDPLGVLSVYVDIGGCVDASARVAAGMRLAEQLDRLTHASQKTLSREQSARFMECLERSRPLLHRMIDRDGRRGRAMFAGLEAGVIWELDTAMRIRPAVALEPTAYVRPLVAALDDGHPAGVVITDNGRVRVLEWRMGIVQQVDESRKQPWPGWRGDAFSVNVAAIARDRGWRQLLIAGEPRVAGSLMRIEPPLPDCHVAVTRRPLEGLSDAALADAVADELVAARRYGEIALVARAVASAHESGEAVLGIEATGGALAAGRISHLVFDDERVYGHWPGEEVVEVGLRIDPAERLIELALDSAAEITPVEGRAARALDRVGGVVGLTRW